ncbi:hypothetical protein COL26_34010 [Bacillus thuringiensis]|uniref:Uncharacterized protein n=1 Tax=Bacillus thuringiensis TaxID=1428 RepID=A0ABD6SMU1_BACTU|nr:hypothetical protein [Bacillus thuringiensis]PER55267.1 hypothetical protein CN495_08960 [Bacillus thuringiensis]PEU74097.1 hypothetical protein CN411_32335 [Bacillus thuringiensis]PFH98148.1 hypothetical protein COI79_33585 [Bacillus thuringiensis]PFW17824.1 hypothetical protein COL26_34010 [Bacillus thuringiensis]PGY64103.1 hypothetical protein COE44_31300 [Bacillus thuringiensis]
MENDNILNNHYELKIINISFFILIDVVRMQYPRYQIQFSYDNDVIFVHFYQGSKTNEESFSLIG